MWRWGGLQRGVSAAVIIAGLDAEVEVGRTSLSGIAAAS